jgi:hypothetical protein
MGPFLIVNHLSVDRERYPLEDLVKVHVPFPFLVVVLALVADHIEPEALLPSGDWAMELSQNGNRHEVAGDLGVYHSS